MDDLDGDSLSVWFEDLLSVDWDVEGASTRLELSAGVVLHGGVIHEFYLVVEVPWPQ